MRPFAVPIRRTPPRIATRSAVSTRASGRCAARSRRSGPPTRESRVASTEPVPGYLLAAAGLRDVAPPGFTRAIEDGSEPSPADLAAMLDLLRGGRARVLLYNSQAVSPITERVREQARAAGIPVVPVTETLPAGSTFQQWQLAQARALAQALAAAGT